MIKTIRRYISSVVASINRQLYSYKLKTYMENRRRLLMEVIKKTSLDDLPYAENGVWHWPYADGPVHLDVLFLSIPMAIKLGSPGYKPYNQVSDIMTRKFWEKITKEDSWIMNTCSKASVPLIFIGPDDPLDPESLALAAKSIIEVITRGNNTRTR